MQQHNRIEKMSKHTMLTS